MYCKNCGNKIKNNYKFCDRCGVEISTNIIDLKEDKMLKNIKIISILGLITCVFDTKGLLLAIAGIYQDYQYKKINGKHTNYLINNIITIILFIFMVLLFMIFGIVIGLKINNTNNKISGEYICRNYKNLYYNMFPTQSDVKASFKSDGSFTWEKYIDPTNNYINGKYKLSKKSNKSATIKMNVDEYIINGKNVGAPTIMGNILFDENKDSFTIFVSTSSFKCNRVR